MILPCDKGIKSCDKYPATSFIIQKPSFPPGIVEICKISGAGCKHGGWGYINSSCLRIGSRILVKNSNKKALCHKMGVRQFRIAISYHKSVRNCRFLPFKGGWMNYRTSIQIRHFPQKNCKLQQILNEIWHPRSIHLPPKGAWCAWNKVAGWSSSVYLYVSVVGILPKRSLNSKIQEVVLKRLPA